MSSSPHQQGETTQRNEHGGGASGPPPPPRSSSSTLIGFLQLHPGLVVPLGYLLLTAVGITYDLLFFELFHIPILNFSEPSDFLLAGFRQPVLLMLFIFSVFALWRLIALDRKWRHRSIPYKALAEKMEGKMWFSNWVLYPLTICVYFSSTTSLYARYTATRIKAGDGRRVVVELNAHSADTKRNEGEPAYLLLGTNSKFLFLYALGDGKARVVPIASVSRMTLGAVVKDALVPDLVGKPRAQKPSETAHLERHR